MNSAEKYLFAQPQVLAKFANPLYGINSGIDINFLEMLQLNYT